MKYRPFYVISTKNLRISTILAQWSIIDQWSILLTPDWLSQWVSEWQGHLLSCPQTLSGQLIKGSLESNYLSCVRWVTVEHSPCAGKYGNARVAEEGSIKSDLNQICSHHLLGDWTFKLTYKPGCEVFFDWNHLVWQIFSCLIFSGAGSKW